MKASSVVEFQIPENSNAATNTLIGSYKPATATITPYRTPSSSNRIESEVLNHIALLRTQTPLLGGENTELDGSGTGFDGMKPKSLQVHTKCNVLKANLCY